MRLAMATFGVWCLSAACAEAQEQPKCPTEIQRAIDEFKIQTANLGLRGDGAAKAIRKQNPILEWHGRLYENFRNDFLDAVPHEIRQRGEDKSLLRRNQYGFNAAGPFFVPGLVHKNGTYLSLSFEGVRERISRTHLSTIPTAAERTGDYSHVVDDAGNQLPIFDRATTRPNPAYDPAKPVSLANLQYLRDPFPGNVIPADRLNSLAAKALDLYPEPNATVGPFFRNNYFINSPEANTANGMIGKVDHAIGERQHVTSEIAFSNGMLDAANWFPTIANPGPSDHRFATRRGSLQHLLTASAQTVNTVSSEVISETSRTGQGQAAFPVYDFQPYLDMGRAYPTSTNAHNTYVWSDRLSTRWRKHSLRTSGQYTRYQVNSFWPAYPDGFFRFSPGLTSLPGIVNTGHAFASFLLGLPEYAEQSFVTSPSYFRRTEAAVVLRDHYDLRKGLALNIRLRVARHTPRVEKYDRQATIDLDHVNPANGRLGALAAAGRDGESRGFRPAVARAEP